MNKTWLNLALLTGISLTGCGGSGGDSADSIEISINASPIRITEANSDTVSEIALSASLEGFADGVSRGFFDSFSGVSSQNNESISPVNFDRLVELTRSSKKLIGDTYTGVKINQEFDCDVSGKQKFIASIASQGRETIGDYLKMEFSNCKDSSGMVSNGVVAVTFTNVVGDSEFSDDYTLGLSFDFDGFSLGNTSDKLEISGALLLTKISTVNGYTIKSQSSQVSYEADRFKQIVSGLNGTSVFDNNTGITRVDYAATVADNTLNGSVSLSITDSFEYASLNASYPFSGKLKVVGSGSSMTLTTLSSTSVKVDIDTNGDGSIDSTDIVSWSSLM